MKKIKFKKKIKIVFIFLLLIVATLLSLHVFKIFENKKDNIPIPNNKETKEKEENKESVYKLSLISTGDALIHANVYQDALKRGNGNYDFTGQIDLIKPIVKEYDLAFYNQETVFGGESLGYSTYPRFNTPSTWGDAMLDAGFNIVSLANNHTLDKGESGVINSLKYWRNTDVMWNGMASSFEEQTSYQIKEKNGITYTMLSYTTVDNGLKTAAGKEYLTNSWDEEKAKRDINALRDKVDLLIVSMHWGVEYVHSPSLEQTTIANLLSDLGVDIIIGTHPHVLQPITRINNTIVMYSLGNFISAQIGDMRRTGALVSLNVTKTVNNNHITIETSTPSVELIYTHRTNNGYDFKVIPFSQITSTYLTDYKTVYEANKKVITAYDENIEVIPCNE